MYPDLDTVQNVQHIILHDDVSFKICTFLLPITHHTLPIQNTLQEQARSFSETFDLEDCLICTSDQQIVHYSNVESYEKSVLEWLRIVD